jgi:hypothetical protein
VMFGLKYGSMREIDAPLVRWSSFTCTLIRTSLWLRVVAPVSNSFSTVEANSGDNLDRRGLRTGCSQWFAN